MIETLLIYSLFLGGAGSSASAHAAQNSALLAMAASMANKTGEPMVCEMLCYPKKQGDWFCVDRAFCGTQEQLSIEKDKLASLRSAKEEAAREPVTPAMFLAQVILVIFSLSSLLYVREREMRHD